MHGKDRAGVAPGFSHHVTQRGNRRQTLGQLQATVNKVRECLASGANLKTGDRLGMTVLHYAARDNEIPAMIPVLLKAGTDLKTRDKVDHPAGKMPKGSQIETDFVNAGNTARHLAEV